MPIVSTAHTYCPRVKKGAGCPVNRVDSVSAARLAAKASRFSPQKRHLMAASLMVSPQSGHGLVSGAVLSGMRFERTPTAQQGDPEDARQFDHTATVGWPPPLV